MARKPNIGARKPMVEETKKKISAGVRKNYTNKKKEPKEHVKRKKDIEIVQMKDQVFDPNLFIPMSTGKLIDYYFTHKGGIPKATIYIIIGDPGSGKSTLCLDVLSDLSKHGYKCLYISAEMTRIDMHDYIERYPKFGNVDMLFLVEYQDDDPKTIVEELLNNGYDMIVVDSFIEVQEGVSEYSNMTMKSTEKWLVDLMISHTSGKNNKKINTTFLAIQQVTKEGIFVGSNKLKHNTTGMLELRFESESVTYAWFTKNRRGSVRKKLYYNLKKGDDVIYTETKIPTELSEDLKDFEKIIKGTTIDLTNKNPFRIK